MTFDLENLTWQKFGKLILKKLCNKIVQLCAIFESMNMK